MNDNDVVVLPGRIPYTSEKEAHDGNIIACHIVRDFRNLLY